MIEIKRTTSTDPDFIALVKLLDADLAQRDGEEHAFYSQFNKIDALKNAIVVYDEGKPVGCGALKKFAEGIMEVKRMYTLPQQRGKGIAGRVLNELEKWAAELGNKKCVLETGKRQPEAIKLYTNKGYTAIPRYGQYLNAENSLCFEKVLMNAEG